MREICSAGGIPIKAPDSSYFSFVNSPYIGHRNASAVDIYPAKGEWGCSVSSPVGGTVRVIKRIKMGRKRQFDTDDFDYAIGIEPFSTNEHLIRVLHCKPDVRVGQEVEVADHLGITLRSRYFNFWTGPHYHVEAMEGKFFTRSSRSINLVKPVGDARYVREEKWDYSLTVQDITPDRIIATGKFMIIELDGGLVGHALYSNDGPIGLLDAGIPHYFQGGFLPISSEDYQGSYFWSDWKIGVKGGTMPESKYFRVNRELRFKLNGTPIRGLSFHIFPNSSMLDDSPPLIVIPDEYGGFVGRFDQGDHVALSATK